MSENRKERELSTREKSARPRAWQRPETLPMPDPRPGWAHRYIRVSTRGETDPSNISSKLREGWEPCLAKDYPEIELMTIENGRFKDNIVIGGLMLCRAAQEMVDERDAYYSDQVKRQMQTVDNQLMSQNNPKMPLFSEKKSTVSFGSGN
jgi:hypothetical protein